MKRVLICLLGCLLAGNAFADDKSECGPDPKIHVKIDDRVFAIPYRQGVYIKNITTHGEEKNYSLSTLRCHKAGDAPTEAVNIQYSPSDYPLKPALDKVAPHGPIFAILAIGLWDHHTSNAPKSEKKQFSCQPPGDRLSDCVVSYMYTNEIRVIWRSLNSNYIPENRLEEFYQQSLEYMNNLEVKN